MLPHSEAIRSAMPYPNPSASPEITCLPDKLSDDEDYICQYFGRTHTRRATLVRGVRGFDPTAGRLAAMRIRLGCAAGRPLLISTPSHVWESSGQDIQSPTARDQLARRGPMRLRKHRRGKALRGLGGLRARQQLASDTGQACRRGLANPQGRPLAGRRGHAPRLLPEPADFGWRQGMAHDQGFALRRR